MNIKDFAKVVTKRFGKCSDMMLGAKHVEYSRNGDKLHNFKEAGRLEETTPERALWSMMIKQYISLRDIRNDLDNGVLPDEAMLAEKVSDVINYLVLFEALILERIKKGQ